MVAHAASDPRLEFGRGCPGEGDDEDLAELDALHGDEAGDLGRDRVGLAGAGAGLDDRATVGDGRRRIVGDERAHSVRSVHSGRIGAHSRAASCSKSVSSRSARVASSGNSRTWVGSAASGENRSFSNSSICLLERVACGWSPSRSAIRSRSHKAGPTVRCSPACGARRVRRGRCRRAIPVPLGCRRSVRS